MRRPLGAFAHLDNEEIVRLTDEHRNSTMAPMSKHRRPLWPDDARTLSRSTPAIEEKRAYRVNDASNAYSISRATIYRLLKANKLRAVKIGGRRLILREDLEALVTGGVR